MGRLRGIEPPNVGTTIRCVNHFATAAKILSSNKKMPWDRVELPTHGASIHCSTNWAIKAKMAVPTGIEPAISCVTGRRDNRYTTGPNSYSQCIISNGDPYGIRTRVTAVKGRCLNHLTNGPIKKRSRRDLNPRAGFPTYTLSRGASSASWVLLQLHRQDSNLRPSD